MSDLKKFVREGLNFHFCRIYPSSVTGNSLIKGWTLQRGCSKSKYGPLVNISSKQIALGPTDEILFKEGKLKGLLTRGTSSAAVLRIHVLFAARCSYQENIFCYLNIAGFICFYAIRWKIIESWTPDHLWLKVS